MPAALIDDDTDQDELIDADTATKDEPEDNGNTPDTPEELAAANEARAKALKQVAGKDEEQDDEPKGQRIPKSRFDEVNNEKKALAEQLAAANAALAALAAQAGKKPEAPAKEEAAPEFDLKAAMRARLQALATGDDDKALELDEQIQEFTLKRAREQARAEFHAETQQMTQRQQAQALAEAAKSIKATYPELDDKSDAADADAIAFVIAKRDALMAKGMAPHEALREAADTVAKRMGFGTAKPAPTGDDPATARLIATRERNARAAAAQPPELSGKGDRATQSARANVAEMSDEEFAKLPEAEKKRLRGDM